MPAPTARACTDPGPWRYHDRWPWIHLAAAVWLATVLTLRWETIQ